MIDGLQGENGDLNNKYLKKKNLKESVANIWKHSGGFRRPFRSCEMGLWGCEISQAESLHFAQKG